jgi:4-hydroxy-tetrahydrodipicolinate synthase
MTKTVKQIKRSAIGFALTPFDAKGKVDEAAFRVQLGRMRDAGLPVYIAGPGLGAAYLLSKDDRDRLFAIGIEELKGKVPCRAGGREPNSADQVIEFLQSAEKAGMDAAQVYSLDLGHGAKPTYVEMERFYSSVIESTSLPLYLSCHHSSGYVPPIKLLVALVEKYPQIAGIHYGGTDLRFLLELVDRFGDRLEIHCAGCFNAATVLTIGGCGFMGAESNIAPQLFAATIRSFDAGDWEAFRKCYRQLLSLYSTVFQFNGNSSAQRGIKPLMNAFGLPGGSVRPPMVALEGAELAAMVAAVDKIGIPELAGRANLKP